MVNPIVFRKLVEVAKGRGTISYTDLGSIADMTPGNEVDTKILGMILDAIADQEVAAGRPLLPVVVSNDGADAPGAWLFAYAARKPLLTTDVPSFFGTELEDVHDYWAVAAPTAS